MKYLLIFCSIFILSCNYFSYDNKENETTQADDTYPFTSFSQVIRWEKNRDVRVKIPSNTAVTVDGYLSTMRTAAVEAIMAWNTVLLKQNINLQIIEDGTNDVELIWMGASELGILGYAEYDPSKNPSRRIVVATKFHSNILQDSQVKSVVIHEIGHILGVWSHSFSKKDIMYPTLTKETELSQRDKATFNQVYQITADINLHALPSNTVVESTTIQNFLDHNPKYNFKIAFYCDFDHSHDGTEDHSKIILEKYDEHGHKSSAHIFSHDIKKH